MKTAITDLLKNRKILFTVISLAASILIGTGAVFAWFLSRGEVGADGIHNQVVDAAEISIDMVVDGSHDKLTFEGAIPGKVYECRIRLTRLTSDPVTACIDFLEMESGLKLPSGEYDQKKSLLNAFGVSLKDGASDDADFTSLAELADADGQPPDFDGKTSVRVLSGITFPEGADSFEFVMYLKFLEFPVTAAGAPWAENDPSGYPLGRNEIVNQYQNQSFRIGKIRVNRE